jgi:hypothetical protein
MPAVSTVQPATPRRWLAVGAMCALASLLTWSAGTVGAQESSPFSGTWVFDRGLSQIPREFGFGADFIPAGGDGRRGPGAADPALRPRGDSYEDATRRQRLTDAVRNPPERVTISETPDTVVIRDDRGEERTFHPDGRAETLQLGTTPLLTTARRDEGKLVVLYAVADLRQLRYTYSRTSSPAQLIVDVQFIERGVAGDTVRLVYKPPMAPPVTTGNAGSAAGSSAPTDRPAAPSAPPVAVPRAGSEFTGLTRIGIVVEEPGQLAIGCGLSRTALEAAASKPFTDAGLRVSRNSDEDTYVHVTVMTSTLPNGMCISRYDWSIYAMTDATLSYQNRPLLVQVLLAHKGGLTGSMPAAHPADVTRGLTDGLTQIAGIIRDANR